MAISTVDELREQMASLDEMGHFGNYPRFTWEHRQAELRYMVKNENPVAFLTWPMIHEALFVGDAPWVINELEVLQTDWSRWEKGIKEVPFGEPVGMEACEETSGNMAHQGYILKQWEDASGRQIEDLKSIFEFGGGYGAMARLCWQLSFRGAYVIQDLPEFSLLQEYYLSNTGITNVVMCNNFKLIEGLAPNLFIAACSLSEVPFEVRDEVLNGIHAKNYVILYQGNYMGRDNHEYFYEFAKTKPKVSWLNYQVPHWEAHWYLVGSSV